MAANVHRSAARPRSDSDGGCRPTGPGARAEDRAGTAGRGGAHHQLGTRRREGRYSVVRTGALRNLSDCPSRGRGGESMRIEVNGEPDFANIPNDWGEGTRWDCTEAAEPEANKLRIVDLPGVRACNGIKIEYLLNPILPKG